MKTIKKDELYRNLAGFLQTKGIELKGGSYPQRISRACDMLTDAINETRKTVRTAKVKVDEKLDQLRQSIHQATAPKPPPATSAPNPPSADAPTRGKTQRKRAPSARTKGRRK